jgi:hypothetical protein
LRNLPSRRGRIRPSKKQTAGCILAITVGKAGLLKPLPKQPAASSQPKVNLPASP